MYVWIQFIINLYTYSRYLAWATVNRNQAFIFKPKNSSIFLVRLSKAVSTSTHRSRIQLLRSCWAWWDLRKLGGDIVRIITIIMVTEHPMVRWTTLTGGSDPTKRSSLYRATGLARLKSFKPILLSIAGATIPPICKGRWHSRSSFSYQVSCQAPSDNKRTNTRQVWYTRFNVAAFRLRKVPMMSWQSNSWSSANRRKTVRSHCLAKVISTLKPVSVGKMVYFECAATSKVFYQ